VRLRYTRPALADLDSILGYISERSEQGAARVHARIETVISLLPKHPRIGIQTDDPAIRRINTSPYPFLIFYEITDEEIIVHAIRHGARDSSGMPGQTR